MIRELWILPGFLGKPADFAAFAAELPWTSVRALDPAVFPRRPFHAWAEWFLREHRADFAARPIHLLGYSLGGRLALHVAEQAEAGGPGPAGFFFVSTNPGLPAEERTARRANDDKWAARFEREDWAETLRAWNAQEVFRGGAVEPLRDAASYDRDQLAWVLREWSLGNQENFEERFARWRAPQLWIAGAKDLKFAGIVENLRDRGAPGALIANASHRVHLDQPRSLALAIGGAEDRFPAL